MNSRHYVGAYNKAIEKLRSAEEFYLDHNLDMALENYQQAAKLLIEAIKLAEQDKALDMMVELQNLLVFVSIEIDDIEQDVNNQM